MSMLCNPPKNKHQKNKGECLMISARQKIGFINNSFFWCQFRITATLTDSPLRDKDISIKTSNFPWRNMMSLLWLSFITASWSCLISLTTFNFQWDTNNSFRVRYLCFKIPIALLHVFESKVLSLALHLVLRSLILSVISSKWLVLVIRFAFFFIVFCLFSFHFVSFLLLSSKTTTQKT